MHSSKSTFNCYVFRKRGIRASSSRSFVIGMVRSWIYECQFILVPTRVFEDTHSFVNSLFDDDYEGVDIA